jgi:hypothetical protein
LIDRVAQRRDDEAAIKKLSEHDHAGVHVIGGELIVLKNSAINRAKPAARYFRRPKPARSARCVRVSFSAL